MDDKQAYGAAGEQQAADFLVERGFVLVDRNVRTRFGEVDLLMTHGETLVGVEVKSRRSSGTGHPAEAVTSTKLQHLIAAMQLIVRQRSHTGPWRLDVVAIAGDQVDYIPNVTFDAG